MSAERPAALYERNKAHLDAALKACETRSYWSPFTESPSTSLHGPERPAEGKARFEAMLGQRFDLDQPGTIGEVGYEISPYTGKTLDVRYPKPDPQALFDAAKTAMKPWQRLTAEERAGVCLEMAFALEEQAFANAHATMHTAGQAYLMAFSGSGANALDRGVEALAYAYKALKDVPRTADWEKSFGRTGVVQLKKQYRIRARGVAVVVCCATFPLWNAYPAVFANLMTGNPVILKPHPNGILPVAMAVKRMRETLTACGLDPNMVLMAADERETPITIELLQHPDCAIIDYTGSQRFGLWIEEHCADKLVYTETAGCNGVVMDSLSDPDGLIGGLANGLCGFSAQMCTSPQNIHIPADGVKIAGGETLSFEEVGQRLADTIAKRTEDPKRAAALCGAVQARQSIDLIEQVRERVKAAGGRVVLDSRPYEHPDFPGAQTATPLVVEVEADAVDLYGEEVFAPVCFLIREPSREAALQNAATLAAERGAISSYLYSSDRDFIEAAQDAFTDAGASLWINMDQRMPINFAAAYSDYHVTGLNPAGNACLADLAFVADRFRIVQFREPVPAEAAQ
ncbi:phenylacetic acid degradation protein PaaN [Marinicauda sp. Alg238-R41]|uniref:phenylacetic acid degradation protein PaaN n=1 Tax=Marinicauda sp. Alg238-R41 TaxID=2993447 RepID=UPI0022E21F9B|nr:phenylacetic acid degradation protein PaaN [Marinicauda sp. Alg238-R41]